jgi:hypothetical protein
MIDTIKLPPTPAPRTLQCYVTPPLDGSRGNPMLHCDRAKGHTGLHTWELVGEIDALHRKLQAVREALG